MMPLPTTPMPLFTTITPKSLSATLQPTLPRATTPPPRSITLPWATSPESQSTTPRLPSTTSVRHRNITRLRMLPVSTIPRPLITTTPKRSSTTTCICPQLHSSLCNRFAIMGKYFFNWVLYQSYCFIYVCLLLFNLYV
jgi:hypothetical protein